MPAEIACPHCDFVMQPKTGETLPTHCPACGNRIACPRCGLTLGRHDQPTAPLHCTNCNVDFDAAPTRPFDRPIKTISDAEQTELSVPGYEIVGELGRGGMGVVYRAHQRSLDRDVAIKVLPPVLALDAIALTRFRNEALLAAKLKDSRILPVHDIIETKGAPVIVMQLVEGVDLGRVLRDREKVKERKPLADPHPWATLGDREYLQVILPVLDDLIAAVKVLHEAKVLHRDIKPSNMLVDGKGHSWLSDFGLARLQDQGSVTRPNAGLGTQGYVSPEQAEGRDVDYRSDQFSLGVTLYKALTLALPYGPRGAQRDSPRATRPSRHQRLLSTQFDAVILKAIDPNPAERYPDVAELQKDWQRVRDGLLPKAQLAGPWRLLWHAVKRHPWRVATAAAMVVMSGVLGVVLMREPPVKDLTVRRTVHVNTEPPGARVALVPLHPESGVPVEEQVIRPEQKTPVTITNVPVGQYLVVAEVKGHGFQEVFRTVPNLDEEPPSGLRRGFRSSDKYADLDWTTTEDGAVRLSVIRIPTLDIVANMVPFPGGTFLLNPQNIDNSGSPKVTVQPFFLDATEVTVDAWGRVRELPIELAKDTPPTYAITWVSYSDALHYAEIIGKRLPDEAEFEWAATMGGTIRYPWGNVDDRKSWSIASVREPPWEHTPTEPPAYGLFSNVAEWTSSWNWPYSTNQNQVATYRQGQTPFPKQEQARIVRGGPFPVVEARHLPVQLDGGQTWNPCFRHACSKNLGRPGLGFRCARSLKPRFLER